MVRCDIVSSLENSKTTGYCPSSCSSGYRTVIRLVRHMTARGAAPRQPDAPPPQPLSTASSSRRVCWPGPCLSTGRSYPPIGVALLGNGATLLLCLLPGLSACLTLPSTSTRSFSLAIVFIITIPRRLGCIPPRPLPACPSIQLAVIFSCAAALSAALQERDETTAPDSRLPAPELLHPRQFGARAYQNVNKASHRRHRRPFITDTEYPPLPPRPSRQPWVSVVHHAVEVRSCPALPPCLCLCLRSLLILTAAVPDDTR